MSRLVKKDNEVKKPTKLYCEVCRKSFGSKNSFDQHERSKRHLQGLKKMQEEFQNAPAPESPAGGEGEGHDGIHRAVYSGGIQF